MPGLSTEAAATHRPVLVLLAYRMLGVVAEAEEVAQDTLVRAIIHPPKDTTRPWRPWLVRVATNLSRDRLRRRRRAPWRGPWLPEPLAAEVGWCSAATQDPEHVALQRRRAGYAWMVALDVLTPTQRAVVLLREVLEWSPDAVAEALSSTAPAVRAAHARARRALLQWGPPEPACSDLTAIAGFMGAMATGDVEAMLAALKDDVRLLTDANGTVQAVGVPVHGRKAVAKVLLGLRQFFDDAAELAMVPIEGGVAVHLHRPNPAPRQSPHSLTCFELGAGEGGTQIRGVYTVLLPHKLHAALPIEG